MWAKRELAFALMQRKYENRIIPILLKECNYQRFHWTLDTFQIIKCTQDFKEGCRELLRVWNIKLKP
jgi:hypothetical protein